MNKSCSPVIHAAAQYSEALRATAVPADRTLGDLIAGIHSELDGMNTAIARMEDRISPVSKPAPPALNDGAPMPSFPPALMELESIRRSIQEKASAIHDMVDRVML